MIIYEENAFGLKKNIRSEMAEQKTVVIIVRGSSDVNLNLKITVIYMLWAEWSISW